MNVEPCTLFTGDNLPILRGIDDDCIDLIYLDPPFNSNKNYKAPLGSKAAEAAFKDTWTLSDIDVEEIGELAKVNPDLSILIKTIGDINGESHTSYLIMMAVRLIEMRRILKHSGSIYLHCDPSMSHGLKLMMDSIFGRKNFRNEMIWCYSRPSSPKQRQLSRVHDTLFWYSKSHTGWKFYPDRIRQPYAESSLGREGYAAKASKVAEGFVELNKKGKFPESWIYLPPLKGNSRESTGFPTQKPLKLLERIIKACSDDGDIVLDPFCGCATACVASQDLGRKWIGIDLSEKAVDLVKSRFRNELDLIAPDICHRTDIPIRSDGAKRSKDIKTILYGRQKGNCMLCEMHFDYRHMEVDHIIPKAQGGRDDDRNLQLLCGHCNRVKGQKSMGEAKAKLRTTGVIGGWIKNSLRE